MPQYTGDQPYTAGMSGTFFINPSTVKPSPVNHLADFLLNLTSPFTAPVAQPSAFYWQAYLMLALSAIFQDSVGGLQPNSFNPIDNGMGAGYIAFTHASKSN